MKLKTFILPATVLVALAASPMPAQADNRGHGRNGGAVAHGHAGGDRRPNGPRAGAGPRSVPRAVAPRVVPGRAYGHRPYIGRPYVGRPYYGRPYGYRAYGRPYAYSFRPRLSIGLGVFLGYPVPYPFYYHPYAYSDPGYDPGYAYPGASSMSVAPDNGNYGGVSLDITPNDAAVTVDGELAGTVDDFNDPSHPLSLPAGRHNLQVRAPGYVTLVFDVDVVAGQVLPYQGDLQRD